MTQVRLLDSIFTRLIAWSMAVCIIVVLILGALVGTKFEQLSRGSQEAAINADLATLLETYREGGEPALAQRIDERLNFVSPKGNAPYYMLVDGDGNVLAGNLATWPVEIEIGAAVRSIPVLENGFAYARAVGLEGGDRLLVARESTFDTVILNEIGFAFVAGGLFVVLAVGVAGRLTTGRLAKRIWRINEAFRHPDEIRLERLARGQYADDEIGVLTRQSVAALKRLNKLIDGQRDTMDQIAHEMRTPLMHLDNRLLRALKNAPDERTAKGLAEARMEIRTVVTMLESLLDISHSEAHRGDARGLAPVDLSALLAHIGEVYEGSAEETGHRFEQDIAPNVTFFGEEMQLTRLITNLLDNAFKYVPSEGTVILELKPGPVITVSDTGPGVAREDRETIFERFQRGRNGNGNGGSGLGLALARAIARRHGLELVLIPTIRGACFRVQPETND